MDNETKQAIDAITAHLGAMENRILERITDTETKLLKSFYDWARPVDSRLK